MGWGFRLEGGIGRFWKGCSVVIVKIKRVAKCCISSICNPLCGGRGIRTPGTSQYGSFQDCCNQPLCHSSVGRFAKPFWRSECKDRFLYEKRKSSPKKIFFLTILLTFWFLPLQRLWFDASFFQQTQHAVLSTEVRGTDRTKHRIVFHHL